ncbi:MAG: glycosyltransferase family 1 protein [Calditrichaeota bacterium]|nr:MAG: glycosyltransferase family 1 protein [Calditrichota bacterium]
MKTVAIDMRMINNSGIGRYLRSIVPSLVSECEEVQFNVLGSEDELSTYPWYTSSNVRFSPFNSPIYSIAEQFEAQRLLSTKPDLYWVPHYNIPVFYSGKMLVTIHDVFHLAMRHTLKRPDQKIYSRLMFGALKRKADSIISVSEFSKNELIKYTNIATDKISVVHNGLDEKWLAAKSEKISADKPYLLFVGNVKPHKNIKRLVQAFKLISDEINCDLMIIGKKEGFITSESNLENEIAGIENRVKFTGFVSDSELKQFYQNALLFVFPSTYEGFGFPPVEAMACGCPVLASNIGAVTEVCGDAAEYCDPYDVEDMAAKILSLLQENTWRKTLIEKGLQKAGEYTQEKCVQNTIAVIKKSLHA